MKNKLALMLTSAALACWNVPSLALETGDPAPVFSTNDIKGLPVKLADDLGNKPIYLKFWATWCSYCVRELPHAQHSYEQYGENIRIITINIGMNDSLSNIKELYQKHNIDLPTVFDKDGSIVSAYEVIGTPYHVLINAEGIIEYQTFLVTDELDQRLQSAYKKEITP